MNEDIITGIFCIDDDFYNALEAYLRSRLLPMDTGKAWSATWLSAMCLLFQ